MNAAMADWDDQHRGKATKTIWPACGCSLRLRLVGDGCAICNPTLAAEYAADAAAEQEDAA